MWMQDAELRHQWERVLRLRAGDKVSLFDDEHEFIYSISHIKPDEIVLEKVTEEIPRNSKQFLLAWSLIKKDNNDIVLQKATELGVTHFVPLLASRSEKTGFDETRATKIVIEAAEQCGRSDIPIIDDLMRPEECIQKFSEHYELYIADQNSSGSNIASDKPKGVLVGPEGGWSEEESTYFSKRGLNHIKLGDNTLRAETAAIIAVHALQ